MKYSTAIVGLGNIGMEYDYDKRENIYTHSRAIYTHPDYQLVAAVDLSPIQRERFNAQYNAPAFESIDTLKAHLDFSEIDILVLSAPTKIHRKLFDQIPLQNLKAIICEKPLSISINDGLYMASTAASNNTLLAVNFWRRCEPGVKALNTLITNGLLGGLVKGFVRYQRGLLNNAAHFIDLMTLFFGKPSSIELLPNIGDFYICWEDATIYFARVDSCAFNTQEFDLHFKHGVVGYSDCGSSISIRKTSDAALFPNLQQLGGEEVLSEVDFSRYQFYFYDELSQSLKNNTPFIARVDSTLESLRIAHHLNAQHLNNKNHTNYA